jgi:hypothetical protein
LLSTARSCRPATTFWTDLTAIAARRTCWRCGKLCWVVEREATSSPRRRDALRSGRRSSAVQIEVSDDPADLRRVGDGGDDGDAGSRATKSQDVYRVDLGQEPSSSCAAAEGIGFVVVRGIGKPGFSRCRAAVPAGFCTEAERRAILSSSAPPRGGHSVAAQEILPRGGTCCVTWTLKSKEE